MKPAETKANRLLQIEALLYAHPEGLTQAEIARQLGVNRSTVFRYLPDLPGHIYIDDQDRSKWKLDRSASLIHVRFNLHEAAAVHLAARLLSICLDRANPHAASALRKLSIPLETLAPHISRYLALSADSIDEAARRSDQGVFQAQCCAGYLRAPVPRNAGGCGAGAGGTGDTDAGGHAGERTAIC